MELDSGQFEARYAYGRACFQRGELDRALQMFDEANRAREDHEALYFAAQTLSALGRNADAEAAYRRALPVIERHLALNPDDGRAMTMAAVTCSRLGDRPQAVEWGRRATAMMARMPASAYNVAYLIALERGAGCHDRRISGALPGRVCPPAGSSTPRSRIAPRRAPASSR